MKLLKILFSVIVVVVLFFGIALFIFWQTFDVNKYRSDIAQQISQMISREVKIGNIRLDLSLSKGASVDISRFVIVDSPEFDYGNFLEVDSVSANVDVWKYITKKQIQVTRVELNAPRLNLIRLKDGRLNLPVPSGPQVGEGTSPKSVTDISSLTIGSVQIKKGAVSFVDHSVDPPLVVPVSQLDVSVKDFAFDRPVDLDAAWGLFSVEPNFDLKGAFKIDAGFQKPEIKDIHLNARLASVSLEQLKKGAAFVPFFRKIERLGGEMSVIIPSLPMDLSATIAEAQLKGLILQTPDLPFAVEEFSGQAILTATVLELKDFILPMASGAVSLQAKVNDYLTESRISADVKAEGLSVQELVRFFPQIVLPQGLGVKGKVKAEMSLTASAANPDPAVILESVVSHGTVSVDGGVLQGFNVMQEVMKKLDKISQIVGPGVQEAVLAKLPDQYKDKLYLNDTEFQKIDLTFDVRDQTFYFKDFILQSEEGTFVGNGNVNMAQNLIFEPQVFVSPGLTNVIVRAVEDLKPLVGQDGRLSIPLIPYSGPVTQVQTPPDVNYLIKVLGGARIKNEIKNVVGDTLGIPANLLNAVLPKIGSEKQQGNASSGAKSSESKPAATSTP